MSDESPQYSLGQVLWAKIRGYPWWPAYVSSFNQVDDQIEFTVNFFGDTSHAQLGCEKLAKFEKNYAEFEVKARTSKKLARSITEAEEALKRKGIVYDLVKKPPRRLSKAQSKLSSDLQSIDLNESDQFDSRKITSESKPKRSPEKLEESVREISKKESCVQYSVPESCPEPARRGLAKKQAAVKEQTREIPLFKEVKEEFVKESRKEKQTKEPKESKESKETKEHKEIKQLKEPKEPKLGKHTKSGNKQSSANKQIQLPATPKVKNQVQVKKMASSVIEVESIPVGRQIRSISTKQSIEKPKKSKHHKQPKDVQKENKHDKNKEQPIVIIKKQPLTQNQIMIERILSLMPTPKQLVAYLHTLEITTNNVKEILDCQVVDVLNEMKDPMATELLKTFKKMIIQKYFAEDSMVQPSITKKSASTPAPTQRTQPLDKQKQQIRRKTVSKIFKFLKEIYGVGQMQLKTIPVQIQLLINQKDPQVGETYRSFALETLKHLKIRTYTLDVTMQKIVNNSILNKENN